MPPRAHTRSDEGAEGWAPWKTLNSRSKQSMHGRLQSVCWCFFVFCFLPRARRLRWLAGSDVVHARPREVVAAPVVRGGHGHHQALRRPLHLADARAKHNVRAQSHDSLRVVHTVGGVRPLTIFAHVHVLQSFRKKLGRSIAIIGWVLLAFSRQYIVSGEEAGVMGMKKSGAVFVRRDLILLLQNPLGGLWRPRGCDGAGGRKREPRWLFVGLLLGKCFSCKDGRSKWAPTFHFSREAGGGYWYCCSLHTIPLVVFQKGTTTLAKGV